MFGIDNIGFFMSNSRYVWYGVFDSPRLPNLVHQPDKSAKQPRNVARSEPQVTKACDGCRLLRTKCDNKTPCSNFVAKERTCSNSGVPKASILTQASEEIESLKRRVKQLEAELKQRSYENINMPTPRGSSPSPSQVSREMTPNTEIQTAAGAAYSFDQHVPLMKHGLGHHHFTTSSNALASS